jgi:hypothetical protein
VSTSGRRVAPPSGAAAPLDVEAPDGSIVDVRSLAKQVCVRYRAEFPDEEERYGDAGQAWCVHDNQYILHWAMLDVRGTAALGGQVGWLARVLAARDFPLQRLVRNLELAAEVVRETGASWSGDVASRLLDARSAVATP